MRLLDIGMKKEIAVLIIVFTLLFLPMILAQDIGEGIDVATEQTQGSFSQIGDNINGQLESELQLANIFIFFFGLEGVNVTFELMVILSAVWIIVLLIIHSICSIIPIFNGKLKSWSIAIVFTILMSITGGIAKGVSLWVTDLSFLIDYPILRTFIGIILIVVIFFSITGVLNIIQRKRDLLIAEQTGKDIARGSEDAKIFTRAVEDLAKGK
jgi:hypothetical protein